MANKNNAQQQLERVRPARVHIVYEVETGGAIEKKELPFVVGIMSDLSGKPKKPLSPLKERKFVEIDRDNFNDVLKQIGPRLAFQVANKLAPAGADFSIAIDCPDHDFAKTHASMMTQQIQDAIADLPVTIVAGGWFHKYPKKVMVFLQLNTATVNKHRLTSVEVKQQSDQRLKYCQDLKQRLESLALPDGAEKLEISCGQPLNVELQFQNLEDFHPSQLIRQIEPLRKLYEERQRLNDLIAKLDGNDKLDRLLQGLINNPQQLEEVGRSAKTATVS